MSLVPKPPEREQIEAVRAAVLACVQADERILLPSVPRDPKPETRNPNFSDTALATVGADPNPFGGRVGPFRYQFEGEDDLLHLFVVRLDGAPLSPEDGQSVAALVLPGVPPGLVWFKPGHLTQHFYLGHDVLLGSD